MQAIDAFPATDNRSFEPSSRASFDLTAIGVAARMAVLERVCQSMGLH